MPDNTLQFETRVNLSGLNSGMEEAEAKVKEFSDNAAASITSVQEATKNLADAQIKLGQAAVEGNEQAVAVIKQYEQELANAQVSARQLGIEQQRQYKEYVAAAKSAAQETTQAEKEASLEKREAAQQAAIEQRRQYEEYIAQVKAEEAANRAASAHQLSALQATSAITRELSSGSSIRAVENFISKTLGLGPAMQAVFPVVGAIAFGEVIFDVGKKIYDAFDLGGERARALTQDLLDLDTEFRHENDSLDLQIAKLEAEQAKLEHRPQNGIALTLAEAANEADHLAERLKSLDDQESKTIEKMSGSFLQRAVLGQGSTSYENVMLQEHVKWLERATTTQGQLNEEVSYGASLQTRLTELQTMQQNANTPFSTGPGAGSRTDYTQEINAVKELMSTQQAEQAVVQKTIDLNKEQGVVNNEKGERVHTPKGPQINRIQLMIEELNQATQINNAFHERTQAMWEQDNRAEMEAYRKGEQADNERTELFKKNQKEMAIAAGEAADATHNTNLGTIEQAQTRSTNANALSLVQDPVGQLQALRNFHQQADAENERYYAEEIKIASGDNELEKVKQLENKMMEVRRAANLRQLNDAKAIALQETQAQQQALQKIETDIATTFAKSLTTQESWAQASIKLYQQVADQFITNLVKMGEQELVALALHKSVASQKILADAKSAAGNAYDWASAWGGPIAGAISAAAAFAGVMAFDSFEQGGIVNGSHGMPVPIMAHAGERVLTAGQTQKFESMVNHGSSSSSSVNLHYNPQVNAYDSSGMRSMLRAHMSDVHDMVNQGIRSGAIRARG